MRAGELRKLKIDGEEAGASLSGAGARVSKTRFVGSCTATSLLVGTQEATIKAELATKT